MKKLLCVLLAMAMVLSLAACGGNNTNPSTTAAPQTTAAPSSSAEESSEAPTKPEKPTSYERAEDEDVYAEVFGDYEKMCAEAAAAATPDESFVLYAKAEAYLLDTAAFIPNTTQGGAYTISRIAPKCISYVQWGNDTDRLKKLVIANDFITKEDRAALLDQWNKALKGEGKYEPAAYLESKGYSILHDYATTFSTTPATIDWVNTSMASDTEITVNCVDGLVEYDNLGNMVPALAESWTKSDDGTVYTFNIRKGVYWYTAEGKQFAEVKAKDFVAGLHHMLDCQEGLEYLVDGVIVGGTDYYQNGGSWEDVGYKALDDYTLEVTLESDLSYFMTMLTYSCFLPICEEFFLAHGGVFGVDEYAAAMEDETKYTFGKAGDPASQVYCGPYLLQKLVDKSEIDLVKNKNYYKVDEVQLDTIKWIYDAGENPVQTYNDVISGVYAGTALTESTGTLKLAKESGLFDKCAYVSDTTSTTYFGGLNLNRGTYVLANGNAKSIQTEAQMIDTHIAMMNKNFRKALQHAFDKTTQNAVSRGEDLAATNLRNMYTHPEFVKLSSDQTDADGHKFPAGTLYGEMVQYYCDQIGCKINVADGQDGWYNKALAQEYLAAAVEELADYDIAYPINIDVVYYSASDSNTAQAKAYKQVVEDALGADKVVINLVETTDSADFYACGYRAADGKSGNYDMFYGSGWGPDYGDPRTYLNTFLSEGSGYMTKVVGLW